MAESAGMWGSLGLDTTCRFAQRLLNLHLLGTSLPVDVVHSDLQRESAPFKTSGPTAEAWRSRRRTPSSNALDRSLKRILQPSADILLRPNLQ